MGSAKHLPNIRPDIRYPALPDIQPDIRQGNQVSGTGY
jgi:hypothetical protein